ncbi:MAG: arabinofuranosyltransferase, partial [Actinomycetota bacterium]|nr:arabinofuranosyltransferase [Actinomycetota bacterium]
MRREPLIASAGPDFSATGRPRNRGLQGAAVGVPLALLAVVGFAHRFIFDDGFIYLRVVRQVRVGHGPVFNTGQRVEAFTSPLWVAILAVADLLTPIGLEWLSILLGVGLSVLGAAFAMRGAARVARRAEPTAFLLPVGVIVFAALVPVWYFESAGLETGMTFAWLGICCWILASWATNANRTLSPASAITLGLGWLVRPELIVDSLVFLVVILFVEWHDARWRLRARTVFWAAALPVAYEIFRMGYYGSLVANTAIAKEGSKLRLGTGWSYLLDFAVPYLLWLPIALLILGVYLPLAIQLRSRGESRSVWLLVAFAVAATANAGSVVSFGGDYLHGRLLLPALFAFVAPVAVVPATKRYAASLVVLAWAAVCGLALRPPEIGTGIHFRGGVAYGFPRGCCGHITLSSLGWGPNSPRRARFAAPAVYVSDTTLSLGTTYIRIDQASAPTLRLPTVASGGIGVLSYALGPRVSVLDLNGLADPIASHLELVRRGYPGHEKRLPAPWVAALVTAPGSHPRAGQFRILPSVSTPSDPTLPFDAQVTLARTALRCHAIAGLEGSTEGSLGLGKFVSNIVHSFGRTSLRIPSSPRLAVARFCPPSSASRVEPAAATPAIVLLRWRFRPGDPPRSGGAPYDDVGLRREPALTPSAREQTAAARGPPRHRVVDRCEGRAQPDHR